MGLAVRVLRNGAAGHGVVRGLVAVGVRHTRRTPVYIREGTGAHHQQSHRRGVVRKGERIENVFGRGRPIFHLPRSRYVILGIRYQMAHSAIMEKKKKKNIFNEI